MAPDRRFGLPHPLDSDPSGDSSPRKPGIWESLRRALGGPPAPASSDGQVERHEPPLPAAPRRPEPAPERAAPADPVTSAAEAPPPSETLRAAPPPRQALDSTVPFLEDPPVAPAEPATPEPAFAREEAPAAPRDPEPTPRLARGLDSFSRNNAEREKRFAHLLRAGPAGGKKPRGPRGAG